MGVKNYQEFFEKAKLLDNQQYEIIKNYADFSGTKAIHSSSHLPQLNIHLKNILPIDIYSALFHNYQAIRDQLSLVISNKLFNYKIEILLDYITYFIEHH